MNASNEGTTANQVEGAADSRAKDRRRVLRRATIVLDNNMSTFSCIIRNTSDGGMRLELDSTLGVPNHFTLIPNGSRDRIYCEVAWRSRNALGIRTG